MVIAMVETFKRSFHEFYLWFRNLCDFLTLFLRACSCIASCICFNLLLREDDDVDLFHTTQAFEDP
jgi:hypothetical protein